MVIDPPSANSTPVLPEFVSATVPGLSTVIRTVELSLALVRLKFGAVMVTVWLLVPVTLYFATWVAPLHTTLVLPQLNVPSLAIATVAPVHAPAPVIRIVPRLRLWV